MYITVVVIALATYAFAAYAALWSSNCEVIHRPDAIDTDGFGPGRVTAESLGGDG